MLRRRGRRVGWERHTHAHDLEHNEKEYHHWLRKERTRRFVFVVVHGGSGLDLDDLHVYERWKHEQPRKRIELDQLRERLGRDVRPEMRRLKVLWKVVLRDESALQEVLLGHRRPEFAGAGLLPHCELVFLQAVSAKGCLKLVRCHRAVLVLVRLLDFGGQHHRASYGPQQQPATEQKVEDSHLEKLHVEPLESKHQRVVITGRCYAQFSNLFLKVVLEKLDEQPNEAERRNLRERSVDHWEVDLVDLLLAKGDRLLECDEQDDDQEHDTCQGNHQGAHVHFSFAVSVASVLASTAVLLAVLLVRGAVSLMRMLMCLVVPMDFFVGNLVRLGQCSAKREPQELRHRIRYRGDTVRVAGLARYAKGCSNVRVAISWPTRPLEIASIPESKTASAS